MINASEAGPVMPIMLSERDTHRPLGRRLTEIPMFRGQMQLKTLIFALVVSGVAWPAVLARTMRSEEECKELWTQRMEAQRQALAHLSPVQLKGKMSLGKLRAALGQPGEGHHGSATNEWLVEWFKGPIREQDAVELCTMGSPDRDARWLVWTPAVRATVIIPPGQPAPGDDAPVVQIRIDEPFPGTLMGLHIGDSEEPLKKKGDYRLEGGVATTLVQGWRVEWRPKDGRIDGWIRASDPTIERHRIEN
jgi:hypothetical protein